MLRVDGCTWGRRADGGGMAADMGIWGNRVRVGPMSAGKKSNENLKSTRVCTRSEEEEEKFRRTPESH